MTRGLAATPEPFDLSAVSRTAELFDALSARSPAGSGPGSTEPDDPVVRLLATLAADVDVGAPPMPAPARVARTMKQPRRGVVRAIVTFGVAAVVMTTAGAAAAGGGHFVNRATGPHAVRLEVSERSIGSLQRDVRAALPPPGRPSAPKEPHFTWRPRTPGLGEASRRSGCGMKPRRAGSGKAARVARSGKAARVVWRSGKTARVRSGKTARVRRSGDDGRGAAPPAAESRMRASGGRIFGGPVPTSHRSGPHSDETHRSSSSRSGSAEPHGSTNPVPRFRP